MIVDAAIPVAHVAAVREGVRKDFIWVATTQS